MILRTFTVTLLLAVAVLLGSWRYSASQNQRLIEELTALNEDMQERLDAREAMIARLSRTRRLAHVEVTGQHTDDAGQVQDTDILFHELDDDGTELARQRFTLPGDVLFIDAWTVKFNHEEVAHGHPLMGRAIVLLRRVYSDQMTPASGFPIDTPGGIPPGYATGDVGRYERQLWEHFWDLATDAELAASMGVRVAQGEAVYKPVRTGQTYELVVDAIGGMSLAPLPPEAMLRGD